MNKERLQRISSLSNQLEDLYSDIKASSKAYSARLQTIKTEIDDLKNTEQGVVDNMPENLQNSERYDRAENAVDSLDEAADTLEDAINALNDII